jgi:hypothetical protein
VHRILGLHRGRGRGEQRRGDRAAGRALERLVLGGAVHPAPAGATDTYLDAVSCASTTACTAVGHYLTATNAYAMLAETGNGTSWTVQSAPTPSGTTIAGLTGISCTSTSACTAVGWYETGPELYDTLAERWNGTS